MDSIPHGPLKTAPKKKFKRNHYMVRSKNLKRIKFVKLKPAADIRVIANQLLPSHDPGQLPLVNYAFSGNLTNIDVTKPTVFLVAVSPVSIPGTTPLATIVLEKS